MPVIVRTAVLLLLCFKSYQAEEDADLNANHIPLQTHTEPARDLQNELHIEMQGGAAGERSVDLTGEERSCQPDMCNLLKELGALEARLRGTENQLAKLSDLEVTAAGLQRESEAQNRKLLTLAIRASRSEGRIEEQHTLVDVLRTEIQDRPKYAFTAALGGEGHVPQSDRETILVFSNVLTNVGQAYNSATGVFAAPVKGVYHFSFSSYANTTLNSCVSLFKDTRRMLSACNHGTPDGNDWSDSASNAGALLLVKGDHVYITLHAYSHIFADYHNRSTFSGFLLYPM